MMCYWFALPIHQSCSIACIADKVVIAVVYAHANVVSRLNPVSVHSRLFPVNAVHGEVETNTTVQVVADLYWSSTESDGDYVRCLLYVT